ncbi:hypothetical protein UT300007_32680 [Clostridium sp. CTA-7]
MERLVPWKVIIDFKDGVSQLGPVTPRNYIVTYSNNTEEIMVSIGGGYDQIKVSVNDDEMHGEWHEKNGKNILYLYVNVDGEENDIDKIKKKDKIYRRRLPLIINSIILSDRQLIEKYPHLDNSDVFIKFNSKYEDFYKVENWGKLKEYKYIQETYDNFYGYNLVEKFQLVEEETRKKKNKLSNEEEVILNLLNPYIQTQLCVLYGAGIIYCVDKSEIININKIKSIDGCDKIYEVSAAINIKLNSKVKKLKVDLIVKSNGVIIKSIKE